MNRNHVPAILLSFCFLFALPIRAADDPASLQQQLREKDQEIANLRNKLAIAEDRPSTKQTDAKQAPAKVATESSLEGSRRRAWLGQLMLRKSIFDEKTIAEPAQFTYVRPASAPEVWSTDVGLGLRLFPLQNAWSLTEFLLGAEYHRNTAESEMEEQFQAGLIAKTFLGEPGDWFGMNLDTRASYKVDNVADTRAISGALDTYPRWPWLWTTNLIKAGPARWSWQPFAGVFYDQTTDTAANLSNGHRLVGRYGAQLLVYPFFDLKSPLTHELIGTSFELATTYTSWHTLDSTGLFDGTGSSRFFTARLSYFFKEAKAVDATTARKQVFHLPGEREGVIERSTDLEIGLSLIYENGEDPQLGLRDIDQLTISLSARF